METGKNKNLEEVFRRRMAEAEMDIRPGLWEKVSAGIQEGKVISLHPKRPVYRYLVAASIGLIALTAMFLLYFREEKTSLADVKKKETVNPSPVYEKPAPEKTLAETPVRENVKRENTTPDVPSKGKAARLVSYETGSDKKEFTLPDGSRVTLNRNSRLVIKDFSGAREIALTGEGFFEVQKDKSRPFRVYCGSSLAEVLGTSFNIRQIHPDSVELFVAEGKVKFSGIHRPEHSEIFTQNQTGKVITGKAVLRTELKNANYLCWKTETFEFNRTPVSAVISSLESAYSIKIGVSDPSILSCHLNGRFEKPGAEKVLRTLALMLNLEVEQKEDGFFLKGQGCQ